MMGRVSVGFPRMNKELSERRVFLPAFIQALSRFANIFVEEGYGSRSGFTFDNFQQGNSHVFKTDHEGAYQQDFVIVLRSPNEQEFRMMRRNACLVSMLHYPTRPRRVELLREFWINAISMDSIVDDNNLRLVENMRAVAWNGLEAAFDVLEKNCPDLLRNDNPYRVLILRTGMVGKHAIDAATKLGNIERNNRHMERNGPGAIALCAVRNISSLPNQMEALFRQADVLVDASSWRNPAVSLVPNAWIDWLPQHAVIADLAVDPYLLDNDPPIVRGVEGIPQGNLNQYVFMPDDPAWDMTVPETIPS